MNTHQIILLTVLTMVAVLLYLKVELGHSRKIDVLDYIRMWFIFTIILILILSGQIATVNGLNNRVKEKCPEYKKIENVYQRVQ